MKVHMMRGGAPDKFGLYPLKESYELIKMDRMNLVDIDESVLDYMDLMGDYIISADEGDIIYANKLMRDHPCIILPRTKSGIIKYDQYVRKDSPIYRRLTEDNVFTYPKYQIIKYDDFEKAVSSGDFSEFEKLTEVAFKTTTGSGSRGVLLVTEDQTRLAFGNKYIPKFDINNPIVNDFIDFNMKEKADIMIQNFIPFVEKNLLKVNVDFIIKGGMLYGYKWTVPDPHALFTNWNFGWHVFTEYTENIMNYITGILTDEYDIEDALMNFEAFSDMKSETWLVEFNWRYSNSTFESYAAGVDMIDCYIYNKTFDMPRGWNKFNRYWRCGYYQNDDHIFHWESQI